MNLLLTKAGSMRIIDKVWISACFSYAQ